MSETALAKQEEPESAYDRLEPRERAFVDAYVGEGHMVASRAARLVGYAPGGSDRVMGSTLLARANVQEAVLERLREQKASSDEVLAYAARVLRMDAKQFLRRNPDGSTVVDPWQEGADTTLVREVGYTRTGALTLKLESRSEALALLMRHHGLLNDRLIIQQQEVYDVEWSASPTLDVEAAPTTHVDAQQGPSGDETAS